MTGHKIFLPLLFAAGSLFAAGNLPSPGGVSVDFSKTKVKKQQLSGSANLVAGFPVPETVKITPVQWKYTPGVWYSNFWVHLRSQDGDYRLLMKQIAPFLKRSVKVENGLRFYRIESGMEAWKFKTPANKDVSFSNQFQQYVSLPDNAGGKRYEITLRYRSVLKTASNANHLRGFITFYDGRQRGAKALPRTNKVLWIKNSASWSTYRMEFEVPQNAKQLNLNLSLYGPGTFDLAEVRISEVIRKEVLKAQLYPQEELSGIYTIGEKSACPVTFSFFNPVKKKIPSLKFELRLPEGFSCSDSAIPQLAVRKEKGATVYSFDLSKLPVTASANAAVRKEFMIRSCFSASGKLYPVSFRTVDGPHVSPWKTVSFRILPRSVNKAPKRFRSGLYLTHQHMLPKEQSRLDFFKDYADAGFNFIQGWFPYKGESGKYLKQRKVIRSYENWFLSNAYHLGQAPKPENAKFRLADGKAFIGKGIRYYSICPSEVIEEGPYYRSEIKKILVDPLTVEDSCDTMMVNHEPFAYNGKGCFCARCREAFIKYLKSEKVKFDAAQFRKSWPGSASAYSEKFIRFCSLRHAETVRVYNKTAAEAGKRAGKISAYIPEINWAELEKQSVDLFRYYSALDYMRDLPVLQPWGPYLFHDLNEEYIYTPGYHLITWGAARAVKEFLKENISVPSQIPQLYAFPHGNQSGSWFTEPEAIVFDSLCFFLNKWEGSVVYIYNMLDYKYFAALSDMNGLIARYEDFIFDGKERRGDRAESVTPMIGQAEFRPWLNGDNVEGFLCLRPEKMGSYIGPENALRLKSFSLGSKILAVAGNFWQRGESFFNLKLKDLKPGSRYTVRQPHAKRSFGTFSGAELMKKGILLHAGALRFAFYTVEEGQLSVPGETFISQTQLKQLMNKRLPVIKKAFAAERTKARNWEKNFASIMNEEKAAVAGKRFDFSVLPSVSNAGVQLAPSGTTVMVTNAVYSLKFHPQKGGIITDLNVKGVRLDTPAPNFGIAMDTLFGAGGVNIDRPMRLESVEPVKDGVKAVLVRKLTMRDNKRYQGITLRKTYVFTSKGFTTTSEFCNDTPAKISLTVRQHNFAPNGTKDAFLTAGQKKFPRDMKHKVLRINNKADKIIKSLKMPVFDIDRAKLIFATSGTPAYVSVTPGKTQPSFILIWENGKSYTAEYIFPETNISPGEKFSYQTTWQIIPVPLR